MAYQYQASDGAVEPFGAIDVEQLGNLAAYSVVAGCAATFSGSGLGVDIAAGVVTVNGLTVTVAGNTVTLVPDPANSNPRWALIYVDAAGVAQIDHGTPAAIPFKPSSLSTDGTVLYAVKIQNGLTIANNATEKTDKRVPGDYALTRYSEAVSTVAAAGATETINLDNGPVHNITLDENVIFTFSNPIATGRASSFTLILRQDGSGTNTVTWPASVKWAGGAAPTVTPDASAIDVFTFFTTTGGTEWLGFTAGQAMAVPA